MNKYEKIYIKAAEKSGRAHWIDSAIAALAVDIEEATGKQTEISGPFGLRAEIYLRAGDDYIIITPEFPEEKIELYYDTGEFTSEYAPGTIGGMNGMNNIRARLPETLDEIIGLLRPSK